MNLDKAREAYMHDPQYHHLVDVLVNQIEALEMTPSEIREAVVFACIILDERRMHPLMRLDFAKIETRCVAADYAKYVLGDWNPTPPVEAKTKKMLVWKECHGAIMPGGDGICNRCKKEPNQK